jgi:hypothetical protein
MPIVAVTKDRINNMIKSSSCRYRSASDKDVNIVAYGESRRIDPDDIQHEM